MACILPDVLQPNLRVVFCGTAAGTASATAGAYYAGPGNQFWPTLYEIRLTPHQFDPQDYARVVHYGIGLTDVAKRTSGADADLRAVDFDAVGFRQRIMQTAPRFVAFNGKRAAQEALHKKRLDYGLHTQRIGASRVFVLPSTSGAARRYWDITHWHTLAEAIAHDDEKH